MRWWGGRQQRDVSGRGTRLRRATARKSALGAVTLLAVLSPLVLGCGGSALDETAQRAPAAVAGTLDARSSFISAVLADLADCWTEQFKSMDEVYVKPALVLFAGVAPTSSESRPAAAAGSFYSPAGRTIYLDLGFYADLQEEYGAVGDAAQAYVIAHEVGHAVQDQLGILTRAEAEGVYSSDRLKSQLLLRVELQADFYAGLAARYQGDGKWMREVDIEKAIAAASTIGNRCVHDLAEGMTVPDPLTHGTLAQRVRWFMLGYETGDLDLGNTFTLPFDEL